MYILYLRVSDFLSFLNLGSYIQQKYSWENANPKKFLYYSGGCCSWNASDGCICCNSKSKTLKQQLSSVILGPLRPMDDRDRMPFSFSLSPQMLKHPCLLTVYSVPFCSFCLFISPFSLLFLQSGTIWPPNGFPFVFSDSPLTAHLMPS